MRLTIHGDQDRRLEVGPWSLDVVWLMRSPYFFGASLAAIHLRASMRIARRGFSFWKPRRGVLQDATVGNASMTDPLLHQWAGAGHNALAPRASELCPKSRLPPLSLRLAPSAGEPLANTVSECEANDQGDCSFQH